MVGVSGHSIGEYGIMLDIVITGSSRPQLFPKFWKSFNEMVTYRGKKRIIWHEDFVYSEESSAVVKYVRDVVDELIIGNPSVGLGYALDSLINNYIENEFVFYIQEDFEFERPIDLDRLVHVMKNNESINLIFLKRSKNALIEEVEFDGVSMCKFQMWSFNPGLWRMDTVRKYWEPVDDGINAELHFNNNIGDIEVRKTMGLYVLGKHNSYNHIRHMAYDLRMEKFNWVDGKPGKHPTKEKSDLENRAPWLY